MRARAARRAELQRGLILGMVENYRSGLVWSLLRKDPTLRRGLDRAGFKGGWLEAPAAKKP